MFELAFLGVHLAEGKLQQPLGQAISHTSGTLLEQLRTIIDRFRAALGTVIPTGATPIGTAASTATVSDLLRRTQGIHQSADFDAVISHIEHSHDNTCPVVDDRMCLVGVIRYTLLSNVMFDHSVTRLVRAEDLATRSDARLYCDEPVTNAFELFQSETDDCIPVVTRDEPHRLLGIVRRSDVVHALITQRRRTN